MIRRAVLLAVFMLAPVAASAQSRERCNFINTQATRSTSQQVGASGEYNTFFGGGIRVLCPRSEIVLIADSLESYGAEGRLYLIGNVHYDEPRLNLTSDFLSYFQRDERLIATGSVVAKLPDGSTLRGPMAEYHRVIPRIRPATRLHSTGRPRVLIQQKDSAGRPAPPVQVDANTITMVGDSLVYASNQVIVTREDVIARGDSMHIDTEREITVILRNPSIESRSNRPFTLSGDRIVLTGRNKKLERVVSSTRARAVSEDMTLASDTIDLRLRDDLLQRAFAWGPSRARASSAAQQIVADSIDVQLPDQRVREMHAIRNAIAEGRPDTTRFRADTVDWLRGDTIVAFFDTVPSRDTARAVQLRQLVSTGKARAYYHLAPADSAIRLPAINYVVGREITIAFEQSQVARVTVREQAAGVYVEPKGVAAQAPDSSRAAPQTPARRALTAPRPRPPE